MKILSLNCQKNYHPDLEDFLLSTVQSQNYDILLLQEANGDVLKHLESLKDVGVTRVVQDNRPGLVCLVHDTQTTTIHDIQYELWPRLHSAEIDCINSHISFGFVMVRATSNDHIRWLGSLHLPSGIKKQNRLSCLKRVREMVQNIETDIPVIIGGDCNFVYPGEISQARAIVSPVLHCLTENLPPTLDSYYSEYVDHLPNKVACFLQNFGVHLRFKTDHFFVDSDSAQTYQIQTKVLPNCVSDHSPIELEFHEKR